MGQKLLICVLLLAPLGVYPFLRSDPIPPVIPDPPPQGPFTPPELLLVQSREAKAKTDPIGFLEDCLANYEKEVKGYKLTFLKQEKVLGKMRPKEKIRIHFREAPFSVHMDWIEGKGKAARTLYVEGENGGRLAARPLVLGIESPVLFDRRVDDPDALATSRFPITEFGIYKGAQSTLDAIRAAHQKGTLHLKYEGIEPLKEVGNRRCYKFVRHPYDPPELDDIAHLTFYVDTETLLQVGSILRDENRDLIAEYYFRDIELNPTFDEKQFTRKSL